MNKEFDKEMEDAIDGVAEMADPAPVKSVATGNIGVYGDTVSPELGEQLEKLKGESVAKLKKGITITWCEPEGFPGMKSIGNSLFEAVPGFYFCNESQSNLAGPYPTMASANKAKKEYAKSL